MSPVGNFNLKYLAIFVDCYIQFTTNNYLNRKTNSPFSGKTSNELRVVINDGCQIIVN